MPPRKRLKLTWFGHSAFLCESPQGTRMLIDPWLQNPKAPAGANEITDVHVIFVTHGHADHLGNTIEIAKRTGCPVFAIHELSLYLKSKGVENAQGLNKGGSVTFKDITATMTDAKHSAAIDAAEGVTAGGEAAGFVFEFAQGPTLYHSGDTALFSDMKLIGDIYKPDIALLPIGGLYTMGPREAAKACMLLKPKVIIGMHYGTYDALAGTPAELKKLLPAAMKKRVKELEVGKAVEV